MFRRRVLDLAPVLFVVLYGAAAIAINAPKARGFTHLVLLSLALTENTVALLIRRRHPIAALAGILAVYLVVDFQPLLLAVLVAVFTVARTRDGLAPALAALGTAGGVVAMPYVHGDPVTFPGYHVFLLLSVGLAVTLGLYVRVRAAYAAVLRSSATGQPPM